MERTLVNISDELAETVRAAEPHIVSIRARRHYPSSGILWRSGAIVTADHGIHREDDITVMLAGGKTVAAALAGRDPRTDLAVLKLQTPDPAAESLKHAGAVKVGELALVIGRSPDSGVNASLGIVSASSGPWRTWRGGQLDAYIRLDAKLFPQSTGGAVVNARGELIGVATSALSRIAGLAIPTSTVKSVTEKLLQKGLVPRGYLGIGAQAVPFSEELQKKLAIPNSSGLILLAVEPGGPADQAGILLGDIVTAIDDTLIENIDDLQAYSDSGVVGKSVKIKYVRGGALKESALTVQERPGKRS